MHQYQFEFIEFAIQHKVLCFGEFTLKSGRLSPYFFNSGLFNDGQSLARLSRFYAQAIQAAELEYDMLFGPAYKGIPLASAVAVAFAENDSINVSYCFNRKEVKDHGEGGTTFGAPLQGKVFIIDDVISAGTSVNLSVDIIRQAGATVVGVAVALDRQERGVAGLSVVQEVEKKYQIKVVSIITLEHLLEYLQKIPSMSENLDNIRHYLGIYGVSGN